MGPHIFSFNWQEEEVILSWHFIIPQSVKLSTLRNSEEMKLPDMEEDISSLQSITFQITKYTESKRPVPNLELI